MTRAELEKWFTIYVAKVYANKFHNGIKTTPLAKVQGGNPRHDGRPGTGLPDRVAEPTAFMLDFMPFEERTIQEYGVVIEHIFFWDDALRPWIHAPDPEDAKRLASSLLGSIRAICVKSISGTPPATPISRSLTVIAPVRPSVVGRSWPPRNVCAMLAMPESTRS